MKSALHLSPESATSRILRAFHADQRAGSAGLIDLPSWVAITCATTGRTTQTSAATVVKGLGANAARARNVGNGWGLSVECGSTNRDRFSEDVSSWSMSGSATASNANGQTAPDGTSTADKLNWIAGADSLGSALLSAVPNGTRGCASVWALADGLTTAIQSYDSNAAVWNDTFTIGATWKRLSSQGVSNPNSLNRWGRHGVIPAGAAWLWGDQLEDRGYPTSYIVSSAGAVARAADVLSVATPANIAPGGFFDLDLVFAPNYADTEFTNDHNLIYFDAGNRVYLQQSTKKIILRIGGVNVLSSALTWSRDQALKVRATHTIHGRRMVVSGATTGNGDTGMQTVSSAVALPATAYLMGDNAGPLECADLRDLVVFKP